LAGVTTDAVHQQRATSGLAAAFLRISIISIDTSL
jgi:hypothetical protein